MLTLEDQLKSFHDDDPVYAHLYELWKNAKFDLEKILQNIILIFPHYSLHNASHSEMIIRYIEAVLGEERIKMLKPTEIWLMLMSAYAHDIGMLVSAEETRSFWQRDDFKEYMEGIPDSSDLRKYAECILKPQGERENLDLRSDWPVDVKMAVIYLTADYVRRCHPDRSKDIITSRIDTPPTRPTRFDFSFFHFIKERIQLLLGKLASLHGASFDDIFTLEKCCQGMGQADDIVYPRRIAAFLRLGDLHDLDNKRFDENAYALIGDVPATTEAHRDKHASLEHFLVKDNKIEVAYDCSTEDAYLAASSWISYLKQETENLALRWNDIVSDGFGSAPVVTSCKIKLNGELIQGNALNSFNFTRDTIFELLQGANIYRNQFACLRELIQNADDASKLRLWEDLKAGNVDGFDKSNLTNLTPFDITDEIRNRYPIDVVFQYDEKEKGVQVSVSDKGIGISDQQLKQMENVSSSWHMRADNKKLYAKMVKWLAPTGAFGVGLQSVFQLTDTLRCETYPRNESAKEIIFRSKKKGGRISKRNLVTDETYRDGTVFTFFIPDDSFNHMTWSLGGIFDQKINELDPFEYDDSDAGVIQKTFYLIECISRDADNNFFPIRVISKQKDKKTGQESTQTLIILSKDKHTAKSNKFEKISDDLSALCICNTTTIIAYNREYAISYVINIKHGNDFGHMTQAFFKGMRLDTDQFRDLIASPYDKYMQVNIYFDGLPTKEYLTLSREKIREEKRGQVFKIVEKDICLLIVFLLKTYKNSPIDNPNFALSLACLTECLLNAHKKDRTSFQEEIAEYRKVLSPHLTSTISCFQIFDDDNVKQVSKKASEVFSKFWGNESFYLLQLGESRHSFPAYFNPTEEQMISEIKELIPFHKEIEKIKPSSILFLDGMFRNIVHRGNVSAQYISGSIATQKMLYHCTLNSDIGIPVVTESIRNEINEQMGKYGRIITDAIKNYEDIAICNTDKYFSYQHRYIWCIVSKAFMISPFSKNDIDKKLQEIKLNDDIDKFWEQLMNRDDFKRLVAYVKEHNLNPTVSEDKIRDTYRRWVYDILSHKETPENSDSKENNA